MPEPIESTPLAPPTIETVLNELDANPAFPADFKNQARTAAGYIEKLDSGEGLQDPDAQRWASQLSRHYLSSFSSSLYHSELPLWAIPQRSRNWDEIKALISQLKTEYPSWVTNQGGQVTNRGEEQDYFVLSPPDDIAIGPRRFKMYVEGNTLLSSMRDGRLTKLFERLRSANIPPASMKLYGHKALPIYFYQDIDRAHEAVSVFEDVGIRYRGPAQDIWIVEIRGERPPGLVDLYSNDQALKSAYKLQRYSPGGLLQDYLKDICIVAGKAPDNPYLTSFVWLVDRKKEPLDGGVKHKLLTEGPRHAGYPLVYKQAPSR